LHLTFPLYSVSNIQYNNDASWDIATNIQAYQNENVVCIVDGRGLKGGSMGNWCYAMLDVGNSRANWRLSFISNP